MDFFSHPSLDFFAAWWMLSNFGGCTSCWTPNGNLLSSGLTIVIVSFLNATTHQKNTWASKVPYAF